MGLQHSDRVRSGARVDAGRSGPSMRSLYFVRQGNYEPTADFARMFHAFRMARVGAHS